MDPARQIWLERLALLCGAAIAAAALLGWRVEAASEARSATVAILASSSSDLTVEPAGATGAKGLRPSTKPGGLERSMTVTNATGGPLAIRVVARPDSRALDRVLAVRVQTRGATLYEGDLHGLRNGSAPFELASHQGAELSVVAWIPSKSKGGWQARSVDVPLTFETRAAS